MFQTRFKNLILLLIDIITFLGSQIGTLFLLSQWYQNQLTPIISIAIFIIISSINGFYKTSISHVGIGAVKQAILSVIASGVTIYFLGEDFRLALFSSLLTLLTIIGCRVFAREVLFKLRHSGADKTFVYGAGSAGIQFATACMQGDTYNIIGYIDDNESLRNTYIHGRIVFPSKNIKSLIKKHNIEIIVLALPSASKTERRRIIESLILLPVRVVTVPTVEDLIDGKQITQIEDISVEDLLGRESVPPLDSYMKARTTKKTCLITGAGGSIGSELCRQIINYSPKHIILLDISEPALFNIEQDLLQTNFIKVSCYLGSVSDGNLLEKIFDKNSIDTVFHAAAYKHVPMVEINPMAGLINNVRGTKTVLEMAQKSNCESFTLISTDKAVRPTNIMGATKRLAEIFCQIASDSKQYNTIISMVRFGNVLGSSGSVIPTFQKQIKNGGPVTITHKGVTRYFMTIPEAAQLVIQSAGMAENGDLFLLDMGDPVKIYDLAQRLIRLSGKSIKHNNNEKKDSAIEIKITGLRPGEKLAEELLIDYESDVTDHPKIYRAKEKYLKIENIEESFIKLITALESENISEFKNILKDLDIGYTPQN
jgi:FlaA1/EpsC-like NDP-sugar epimerase